ncbi:MAG: PAS domain S-box protein, partial [Calditrichaeota bacterium]|nr:PAS domain S-box protein [Calditrichota bacterium]
MTTHTSHDAAVLGQTIPFAPEQARDGIFALDRRGRFFYANPRFLEQVGRQASQLHGCPLEELVSARHQDKVRAMLKQLLRGIDYPPIEVDLATTTEGSVPAEIHAWSIREGGRIAGVQGTCRDLRPRHGVHEESLGTTELYNRLFDLTPEAIIITGAGGRVVKANQAAARMFGFETPEAILGRKGVTLYADPTERETIMAQLREHGFAIQPYGRFRRKDGSLGHCSARIQALYDQAGQVLG